MNATAGIRVLGIIPARAGSKGLPNKNMAILGGKPLIQWTIEAAKDSGVCEKIVVASDSKDIRVFAESFGIETIVLPESVTTDSSPMRDAINFVLEELGRSAYEPEWILLLQPTSPLRNANHVREAMNSVGTDDEGLISVYAVPNKVLKAYTLDAQGHLQGLGKGAVFTTMTRAELPEVFMPNGALYLLRTNTYHRAGDLFAESVMRPYVMEEADSIDIDSAEDLAAAEGSLRSR